MLLYLYQFFVKYSHIKIEKRFRRRKKTFKKKI